MTIGHVSKTTLYVSVHSLCDTKLVKTGMDKHVSMHGLPFYLCMVMGFRHLHALLSYWVLEVGDGGDC